MGPVSRYQSMELRSSQGEVGRREELSDDCILLKYNINNLLLVTSLLAPFAHRSFICPRCQIARCFKEATTGGLEICNKWLSRRELVKQRNAQHAKLQKRWRKEQRDLYKKIVEQDDAIIKYEKLAHNKNPLDIEYWGDHKLEAVLDLETGPFKVMCQIMGGRISKGPPPESARPPPGLGDPPEGSEAFTASMEVPSMAATTTTTAGPEDRTTNTTTTFETAEDLLKETAEVPGAVEEDQVKPMDVVADKPAEVEKPVKAEIPGDVEKPDEVENGGSGVKPAVEESLEKSAEEDVVEKPVETEIAEEQSKVAFEEPKPQKPKKKKRGRPRKYPEGMSPRELAQQKKKSLGVLGNLPGLAAKAMRKVGNSVDEKHSLLRAAKANMIKLQNNVINCRKKIYEQEIEEKMLREEMADENINGEKLTKYFIQVKQNIFKPPTYEVADEARPNLDGTISQRMEDMIDLAKRLKVNEYLDVRIMFDKFSEISWCYLAMEVCKRRPTLRQFRLLVDKGEDIEFMDDKAIKTLKNILLRADVSTEKLKRIFSNVTDEDAKFDVERLKDACKMAVHVPLTIPVVAKAEACVADGGNRYCACRVLLTDAT